MPEETFMKDIYLAHGDTFEREAIYQAVDEWQKAESKHGANDNDDFVWSAVLCEETGEVARAVLESYQPLPQANNLETELAQVAGVALAWLAWLKRRAK